MKAAVSALVGGGIGLVWTLYMALVLFKHSVTHGVRLSAISFFAGWLFKVVMTIGIFLMLLQTIATFCKDVAEARGKPIA